MASPVRAAQTAADLMTANLRTCSVFSSVIEAVLIFRDADCGAVPIIDDGKPVGILTDRDVALALAVHGERLPALPVSEIMTTSVVTVAPDDSLDVVLASFGDQRVRRLVVIDAQGLLRGIIAWADVAPHVSDQNMGHAVTEVVDQT